MLRRQNEVEEDEREGRDENRRERRGDDDKWEDDGKRERVSRGVGACGQA